MTLKEACRKWVSEFNSIPQGLIEKAYKNDIDDIREVTPLSSGDSVYIYAGKFDNSHGEIVSIDTENKKAVVLIDGLNRTISIEKMEVQRDGFLPIWGTMWTFGDSCDKWWLDEKDGLQAMADCGFRIYESDELGYFFGIDGAGYDFYESHWIPLYEKRGLKWHDMEAA